MDENQSQPSTTYQKIKRIKQPTQHTFLKSVLLPFLSGMLGTTLIIGICFGIPNVRNYILGGKTVNTSTNTNTDILNNSSNQLNLTAVSLQNYSDTSISVASKIKPSIVGIKVDYTSTTNFFGRPTTSSGSAEGSGIIISEDGYILTNNHIIAASSNTLYSVSEASKVSVYLYGDETPYEATIVGTDELTDLAVIKIDKTGLTAAELGNSDNLRDGEFVMAIGNPLGLQSSVTCGVVSALNREVTDSDGKKYVLIQTDAAINEGNSGGALVNSQGQVIGVNTLKLSGTGVEGMGFAIPINSTKDIYSQLIQYNKVKRPYIGIGGIDLTEQLAKANNLVVGIYVKTVEDFSAAQKADIRIGDVIIEVDGQKVETMNELTKIKNNHKIGDIIKLKIVRDGSEKEINLTLIEQP